MVCMAPGREEDQWQLQEWDGRVVLRELGGGIGKGKSLLFAVCSPAEDGTCANTAVKEEKVV